MSYYLEVETSTTGHSGGNSSNSIRNSSNYSYDYKSSNREVFVTSPISSSNYNTSNNTNSIHSTTTSTTTPSTPSTSSTSPIARVLYVFDFDWSLVDENSDTYVLEK